MLATATEEQQVLKKAKITPQDVENPSPHLQSQTPINLTTPIATAGSHAPPTSNVTYVPQTVIPNHHANNPKVAMNTHPMWNGNASGHTYAMHPRQGLTSNVLQHTNGVPNAMHTMPPNAYVNSPQGYVPMNSSAKISQVAKYVMLLPLFQD